MRSLIENHVDDFLEILTYDKRQWPDFWKKLPYKPITDRYSEMIPNFFEKLIAINRSELTEFLHAYESIKDKLKEELSIKIRKNARDFELSKEDFVIYLIVGI
ncbi:MAG: diguanylate cyclase, partial [Fervidobacterium sp.]